MRYLLKNDTRQMKQAIFKTNISAVQRGRIPPNAQHAYSSTVLFGERLLAVNQGVASHFSSIVTHLIRAEPYPPTACKCFCYSFYL